MKRKNWNEIFFVLFASLFVAGCSPSATAWRAGGTYHKQGLAKLQSNQCSQAVEDFTQAIGNFSRAVGPGLTPAAKLRQAEAYLNRSQCYKTMGKLDLAFADQEAGVKIYKELCDRSSLGPRDFGGLIELEYEKKACPKIPAAELVLENLRKEMPPPQAVQGQGAQGDTRATLQDILRELQKEE